MHHFQKRNLITCRQTPIIEKITVQHPSGKNRSKGGFVVRLLLYEV